MKNYFSAKIVRLTPLSQVPGFSKEKRDGLSVLSFRGSRALERSNPLAPGSPPFILSFIAACLFGVGLKGAGWTRTENDISTRTT